MLTDERLPASLNRRIGQAMHDYGMLADGDRVLVAVSGGIDSLMLAWILTTWQKKAPISYEVPAVGIDHGVWRLQPGALPPVETIGGQLAAMGLGYRTEPAWPIAEEQRTCYQCARNRRSQLFALARDEGYNVLALGHHKDDLVETFFLNILYSGNISTMRPKQQLFDGRLAVIRPMAYLGKEEILEVGCHLGLAAVPNLCPLAKDTRREKVREILADIDRREPGARRSIFAALANVRKDYML